MSEALYSEQEHAQWRGPTSSDNYNERVENLYKDLMVLANRVGLSEENLRLFYQRILKEQFSLMQTLDSLEERVEAIEAGDTVLTFGNPDAIDIDRFDATDYAITDDAVCTWDGRHSIFTLPNNATSSFSKLKMVNTDGISIIPSSFESLASGVAGTADDTTSALDTSDVYHGVLQETGMIWERNVLADTPHASGAEVDLYIRFPTDLVVNENTNCIIIHPFPTMGCDLIDVEYTTVVDVSLNVTDAYQPLNGVDMYNGVSRAIGWVPPGGWTGDEINSCGSKIFYFDPVTMTGLKIRLRQRSYFTEESKYIYTYGMSQVDARFEKFADTGKTILKFDAPAGSTISSVDNVTPDIWNVIEAEVPDIFFYRVIWETAYGSGTYTTTPVPLSKRVWIEVTLNKTSGEGTPVLSGLNIEYS